MATSFGPWSLSEVEPGRWPSHYADTLLQKERLPAETFLVLDPLVSISAALAACAWVWSLAVAGAAWFVPRGFCGYLCPLGTLIDLFDWAIARRIRRFRVSRPGWWIHLKYYLLAAVSAASLGGVLLAGFVAAIPVLTRAAVFLLAPVQTGLARDWHQIPGWHAGHFVSLALFVTVLALGFLQPRFWCKYVCPTGAVFSLGNLFPRTHRAGRAVCRLRTVSNPLPSHQRDLQVPADLLRGGGGGRFSQRGSAAEGFIRRFAERGTEGPTSFATRTAEGRLCRWLPAGLSAGADPVAPSGTAAPSGVNGLGYLSIGLAAPSRPVARTACRAILPLCAEMNPAADHVAQVADVRISHSQPNGRDP